MNYDEVKLRILIDKCQWTFAKTMPTCPHDIVRNECCLSDEEQQSQKDKLTLSITTVGDLLLRQTIFEWWGTH